MGRARGSPGGEGLGCRESRGRLLQIWNRGPTGGGLLAAGAEFYEELGNHYKVAIIRSQLGREQMHGGNLAVQDLSQALENLRQAKTIFDREPEGIPHGMVYCGLA